MSSIVVAGDTSGTVTLQAPAIAGTTTLNLPATSGTIITGAGGVTAVTSGGTGAATLSANAVILGNGTSAVQTVAPGTSGNVLTSNGTSWTSAALPAGGVTSLNGQTGAITNTSLYAIGSVILGRPQDTTAVAVDTTLAGSSLWNSGLSTRNSSAWINPAASGFAASPSPSLVNTGTWRCLSSCQRDTGNNWGYGGIWVRIS